LPKTFSGITNIIPGHLTHNRFIVFSGRAAADTRSRKARKSLEYLCAGRISKLSTGHEMPVNAVRVILANGGSFPKHHAGGYAQQEHVVGQLLNSL